jgi:hypothetical protein
MPGAAKILLALACGLLLATARGEAQSSRTVPQPASTEALNEAQPSPEGSRDPIRDLGRGVRSFALDTWEVITEPTRFNRSDWLKTGAVLAVGGMLLALDQEIWEADVRNRDMAFLDGVGSIGEFLEPVGYQGNTNSLYAGGVVLGYALRQDRLQRIFQELLFSHLIAGATRQTLGRAIGRRRPDEGMGAYERESFGGTSFPSGHASTVFQVAAVLSHHIDRRPATALLYGLAGTVAYQRLADDKHWPSDIWIGSWWGWGVAKVVIRMHENSHIRMEPTVDPTSGGLGLRVWMPL